MLVSLQDIGYKNWHCAVVVITAAHLHLIKFILRYVQVQVLLTTCSIFATVARSCQKVKRRRRGILLYIREDILSKRIKENQN